MSDTFRPLEVPPWGRWGQRRGLILDRRDWGDATMRVGPNRRPLCKWCKAEVPPRRRSWCSDECVNKYSRVWSWEAVRRYVKERDRLTCQCCGTTDPPKPETRSGWGQRYDPWDVDHIVPVIQGGTDDPDNLRLLCMDCHVEVGYEQRGTTRPEPHPDLFDDIGIGAGLLRFEALR